MDSLSAARFISFLIHPLTLMIFVFGAMFGSFFNVCILRLPEGTFLKNTRSHCPHCGAKIPVWLNIPILAWFILRGKTNCCKNKLSFQYPLVEFITAAGFVFVYWAFPFFINIGGQLQIDGSMLARFLHAVIFFSILLICSFIDLKHMIIPDVLSVGMVVTTPIWVLLHPSLTWIDAGLGVLIGGGILYAIAWLYWLLRKQAGMGMGDVKLLAGIGGWLGYQSVFPTLFYASITGSVVGIIVMFSSRKSNMRFEIPFGPFLALGALMYLFYGSKLIDLAIGRG